MDQPNPQSNRRVSNRKKSKSSTKLTCIDSKLGVGPNVAVALLDVSETGIRMILKTPLSPGHDVEIGLEPISASRATTTPAKVVWCAALSDGSYCIGARFAKAIPYALLHALASV